MHRNKINHMDQTNFYGLEDDESEVESSLRAPVNFKSYLKCTCGQPSTTIQKQCLKHYASKSKATLAKLTLKNNQSLSPDKNKFSNTLIPKKLTNNNMNMGIIKRLL